MSGMGYNEANPAYNRQFEKYKCVDLDGESEYYYRSLVMVVMLTLVLQCRYLS